MLAPSAGGVLRVPFGQIASVTEPEPFTVRITLSDGNVIDLSRLGVMRTQLLAGLRDGRGDDAAAATAAVGDAAVFSGFTGDERAEIRVYDDCLVVIGGAGSERISFSFAGAVQSADYAVRIEVTGRDPVTLSRLGRRTGELVSLLNDRLREARGRTAAFLGSLLPGLSPMALRDAAGLLRDGAAVLASALDSIHPELARTLVQVAALPGRRDAIAALSRRAELAIGFKQLVSIRQDAVGVTPWRDHAATPHIGEHDSPGGAFQPGLMGMMAAGVMASGPPMEGVLSGGGYGGGPFGSFEGYGGYGDYWAFRALGAGTNTRGDRPMAARPDVTRGRLTPAAEDLPALTVTGEDATVLAFVLASNAGRVAYEVLNQQTPVTFVYRADGPEGLAAINRALDDAGFQAAAVHSGGLTAPAGPAAGAQVLAASLAGQVPHDPQWPDRIAELLEL
ncbi:MAG TPA: hypothetical protein VFJ07_22170 [Streptosporangiaceae bacterium]|nr:hypothetical protein [Streptosporangiaceae bacterium]